MTLDFKSQRLYFADISSGAIQSVDFDGESRKVVYVEAGSVFSDIDIFQDLLIWSELENGLHFFNRETEEFLYSTPTPGRVYGIVMLDFTRQPNGTSPCMVNNGGCEQICLPGTGDSITCVCSSGFISDNNGECNNYIVENNFLLLIDTGRKTAYQIDLQDPNYAHTVLHMGPLNNPIAIGFDPVDRYVYISDADVHLIKRSLLGGREFQIIIHNAYAPGGLAVDHIHRLLFWSDGVNGTINVSGLDGSSKTILISSNIEKPRAIAVDSIRGLLFWTDCGTDAKIECSWMDGTSKRVLVEKHMGCANGLALDAKYQFLYWCDTQMNRIERVKYDGSQRTLMKQLDYSAHPFDIVVDDSYIYFTDWNNKTVLRMSKVENDQPVAVGKDVFGKLSGLILYNSSLVPNGKGFFLYCLLKMKTYSLQCLLTILKSIHISKLIITLTSSSGKNVHL
ncbi:low-density lipoprotein receptor-related protein 5-like [Antedon mediterranea]|uniref:low-density lipoprotein receptor-related protein 5-like n=1 Tax=Antedon mediterranea TaxID=105859 RepID=UPI003AF5DC57